MKNEGYQVKTINNHKVEIFRHFDGQTLYITNAAGVEIAAQKVEGDAIARAKEIIEAQTGPAARFDEALLMKAAAQALNLAILFSDPRNETEGGKIYNAYMKATSEIENNFTLHFNGELLTFVSRFSKERRAVTKSGCTESCKCKNRFSYHQAIFAILEKYAELKAPRKTEAAGFSKKDLLEKQIAESSTNCAKCKFNWDDKFFELCENHEHEADHENYLPDTNEAKYNGKHPLY